MHTEGCLLLRLQAPDWCLSCDSQSTLKHGLARSASRSLRPPTPTLTLITGHASTCPGSARMHGVAASCHSIPFAADLLPILASCRRPLGAARPVNILTPNPVAWWNEWVPSDIRQALHLTQPLPILAIFYDAAATLLYLVCKVALTSKKSETPGL